jgi:hypothetical protein
MLAYRLRTTPLVWNSTHHTGLSTGLVQKKKAVRIVSFRQNLTQQPNSFWPTRLPLIGGPGWLVHVKVVLETEGRF